MLPPDLSAAATRAAARVSGLRLEVRWFPTVTSTMDTAAEAIARGAAEGVVIVADEQTAGRGRRGRSWTSPAGSGLYASFVLRPSIEPALSLLTLAAGVAVHDAIRAATGLMTALKWPNDVMVGRRKLAGILAEGLDFGSASPSIVLGVGLNVMESVYPAELNARVTSLEGELGRPIDRMIVFEALMVAVADRYEQVRRGEASDILRAWRDRSPSGSGATVEWDSTNGVRRGVTRGIDDAGALLVQSDHGIERLVAGEVRWCS